MRAPPIRRVDILPPTPRPFSTKTTECPYKDSLWAQAAPVIPPPSMAIFMIKQVSVIYEKLKSLWTLISSMT